MKEVRNCNFEVRNLDKDSRTVEGYALVFESESNDLGGFTEKLDKNCLTGVLEKSDVLCLLNHNEDKGVLARCNKGQGSLTLEVDDTGLKYTFEAPKTALGDELLEGLRRKDITESSFAFVVDTDNWQKREDGSYLRTITHISQLFDVSPVYKGAYSQTSVNTRGLDDLKQKEKIELDNYYKELENKINKV